MGGCLPCLNGEASDHFNEPSPETRRRQQAEAAEKRVKEIEGRGVKDPEKLKQKQKRLEELEKAENSAQSQGPTMRWQVS